MAASGVWGPLLFVLAYVIMTVIMVPGSVMSLATGLLFGPVWGVVLVLLSATLGSQAAFEIARRLGHNVFHSRIGQRLARADTWITGQGFWAVLGLRLLPVVPFNALNYALGLSNVTRRNAVLGTLLGIIPGTVAVVGLGSSLTDISSWAFVANLTAVIVIFAVGTMVARRSPVVKAQIYPSENP